MLKPMSTCNSFSSRSSVPNAEVALWGAKLRVMMDDAIYPFKISDDNLDKQFKKLVRKIKTGKTCNTKMLCPVFFDGNVTYRIGQNNRQSLIDAALFFFESAALDRCLEYVGRENQVEEVFAFVQGAVTLRKRYNVTCMKHYMMQHNIKTSQLTEQAKAYIGGKL